MEFMGRGVRFGRKYWGRLGVKIAVLGEVEKWERCGSVEGVEGEDEEEKEEEEDEEKEEEETDEEDEEEGEEEEGRRRGRTPSQLASLRASKPPVGLDGVCEAKTSIADWAVLPMGCYR